MGILSHVDGNTVSVSLGINQLKTKFKNQQISHQNSKRSPS